MLTVLLNVARIAAVAWLGLIVLRGRFWEARADDVEAPVDAPAPDVHAVVPARNEADVIGTTLASLVAQQYPGRFTITLVDDTSDDGTAEVAAATVAAAGLAGERVQLVAARPRAPGWTGKLWALAEGVAAARAERGEPAYWWFSDADVAHAEDTLARLVATAERRDRHLVSLMVQLHCRSPWERLLIPAFVFFFKLLYPFAWVNDDRRATAAAAGGCVLLEAEMLRTIGGLERIRGEMIDDCSLAAAVKGAGGRLWLGLATRSQSIRPYAGPGVIWNMVARTAYTQLRYSPALLAGTVAGMVVLYVAPPAALGAGLAARRPELAATGAVGWSLTAAAYAPMIRRYRAPLWLAATLPLAGLLYTAMTVDSARRHRAGRGGAWKGRTFKPS